MRMATYILRRLIMMVPVIFGVTLITFILTRADINVWLRGMLGPRPLPGALARLRVEFGLNQPIYVQYGLYMKSLLSGNWGFTGGNSEGSVPAFSRVLAVMSERLPNTIELAVLSVIIVIVVSLPLGVISAVKRDKLPDHASRLWAMISYSTPSFWLGLLLIFVLAPYIPIGDITGNPIGISYYVTSSGAFQPWVVHQHNLILGTRPTGFSLLDTLLYGDFPAFFNGLEHIILPAITVALTSLGAIVRFLRSSMLDSMGQDYVRTAKAKGLSQKTVINKHVKRNAYSSTVTILGLLMAFLMGGVVITEEVFSWPGIGYWLAEAAVFDDVNSVMAAVFVFAIIIVVANLIVDIIYAYLDPRVRLG